MGLHAAFLSLGGVRLGAEETIDRRQDRQGKAHDDYELDEGKTALFF
jgi:hypothetical protein